MSATSRDRRIRVLCFGDSNTWGYCPADGTRYPEAIRWTGRLQRQLGDEFQVIEEGLNGRTTVFTYAERFGKNGRDYLRPCMDSHFPLDVMIVCLGTNDTKREFDRTAEQIAEGMEEIVRIALGHQLDRPSPGLRLVVAAPVLVDERHLGDYDKLQDGAAKTAALPALYRALAGKHGAAFVDLTQVAPPSALDGIHLDASAHAAIADAFTTVVRALVAGSPP